MLSVSRVFARSPQYEILSQGAPLKPPHGGGLFPVKAPVNYNLTWNEVVQGAGPHTHSEEPIRDLNKFGFPQEVKQHRSVARITFYLANFGKFTTSKRVFDWAAAQSLRPVTTRECLGLAKSEQGLDNTLGSPNMVLATLQPCSVICQRSQVVSVHWSRTAKARLFLEAKLLPLDGGWNQTHWLAFKER